MAAVPKPRNAGTDIADSRIRLQENVLIHTEKKYAWRVQARTTFGFGDGASFENNGYSEIYDFTFKGDCDKPQFVLAEPKTNTQVKVSWQQNPNHTHYMMQTRKKGTTEWFEGEGDKTTANINDLEAGQSYEFRVGAYCMDNVLSFSAIVDFTMPEKKSKDFQCGLEPNVDLSNQTRYSGTLRKGQEFMAGDFAVRVLEATGTDTFTGKAWIKVPYLGLMRIAVEFKDIQLNTDLQLMAGEVKTTYDPEWKNILDINEVVDEVDDIIDAVTGNEDVHDETVNFTIGDVNNIKVEDGKIKITNPATGQLAKVLDFDKGEVTTIRDKDGNVYNVDKNGEVTKQGDGAGQSTAENTQGVDSKGEVSQIVNTGYTVVFSPLKKPLLNKITRGASDQKPQNASTNLAKLYKTIPNADGLDYDYLYQAVSEQDKTDYVLATLKVSGKASGSKPKLVFKANASTLVRAVDSTMVGGNRAYILELKAFNSAGRNEISAVLKGAKPTDKDQVIGAMMQVDIKENPAQKVVVVPVNGASVPSNIETKVNEIYQGTGGSFKISIADNYQLPDRKTLDCGKSGWFANYTDDQNAFIAQYAAQHPLQDSQRYVFVMKDIAPSRSLSGFMPLGRQVGFLFPASTGEEAKPGALDKLLAHELGHGVYELQHPWENSNIPKGSTDWLMDYDDGTKLPYIHWEQISHPKFIVPFLKGDASGELAGGYGLSPDWRFVSNKDERTVTYLQLAQKGFLGGLVKDTKKYKWSTNKYVCDEDATLKIETVASIADGSKIYLFFDNDKPINQNKYLRTVYNKELKDILSTKNPDRLSKYIDKYATTANFRQKDENRQLYWGYIACSNCNSDGVENGNGSGGLVVDKTAKIPADELKQLIAQVSTSNQVNGINAKIFITAKDDTKGIAEVEKAIADLEKSNTREIYIWAKNYQSSANFDVELAYGKGLSSKEKLDFDNFEATIKKINSQKESWLACIQLDGTYIYFNPLTALLDGLAGLIGQAKIPERFYNPDAKDYNPFPAQVYRYASLSVFQDKLNDVLGNPIYNGKYTKSRAEFAFSCGVWNGFVLAVGGIPEGASMIVKLITNEKETRTKMFDTFSKMEWKGIKEMAGKEWDKYTANPCMVSYGSGAAGFMVISCFYGAGEAKGVATIFQSIEKLDAVGKLMGTVAKLSGKLIKPILVGTGKTAKFVFKVGKAFFEPGIKFAKLGKTYCTLIPLPIDLTDNMARAIEKAKDILQNKTAQFEEKINLLTDENDVLLKDGDGNLLAEIEIDGEKVKVLVNEKPEVLEKAADELEFAAKNINKVINNIKKNYSKWGLATADEVDEIINTLRNNLPDDADNILATLDNLVENGTTFTKIKQTINEVAKYKQFGDGSKWTLKYLSKNINTFKGKNIIFESTEEIIDEASNKAMRYIDVKVVNGGAGRDIFYEFKSVRKVPPGKFAQQFIKDLSHKDVTDLRQLKWLFDSAKAPINFTENIKIAIRNLPINKELAEKFGYADIVKFKE